MVKKSIVLVSIFLLFCGIVACREEQLTPQSSGQTKIPPTVTKKAPTPTEEQTAVFDLFSANKVPPEDILTEISFYGAGGQALCWKSDQPVITYEPQDGELMTLSTMIACGWQNGDILKGSIRYPDGRLFTKDVKVKDDIDKNYAMLEFKPAIDDPPGVYTFILEGKNGKVEDNAYFVEPDGPRLYRSDTDHLFVYGYEPNEQIRLFHYTKGGELAGWQEYEVDKKGALLIKISVDTHPYFTYFIVIGELSGESRLLQEDFAGTTMDRIRQTSIQVPDCGKLPPRLSLGNQARVAFTDGADMRIRVKPGLDQAILEKVPEGTRFSVLDGPSCVNEITWWKVHTNNGFEGWVAEFDDDVYLLEPVQ